MKVTKHVVVSLLVLSIAAVPMYARGKKTPATTEPGKYTSWGPDIDQLEVVKKFKFGSYSKVVVEPFDTSEVKLPEAKDNTYEPVKTVLASATEGFVQGLRGGIETKVAIDEKPGQDAETLIIRGKVLEMAPGSKAARAWAGFGAGAARAKLEGEIVDARSGDVLARFTQERRSGVGVLGGDYQELMQRNLNTVGKDVANILKAFSDK